MASSSPEMSTYKHCDWERAFSLIQNKPGALTPRHILHSNLDRFIHVFPTPC